jgi:hypothetical protein
MRTVLICTSKRIATIFLYVEVRFAFVRYRFPTSGR